MSHRAFVSRLLVGRAGWRARLSPFTRGALFYGIFWGHHGLLWPFLNVYLVGLGISGSQLGVISALTPAMTMLVVPFITSLADRKARRATLLATFCGALAISYILLGTARDFYGVLACALVLAFCTSPTVPLADALVIRLGVRHAIDYGKMRLWGSVTFAVVTIVMGFVWARFGMRWMFPAAAAGALATALGASLLDEEAPVRRRTHSPWRLLIRNGELLALFMATVLIGAAIQVGFAFGSVYMRHMGGDASMVGLWNGLSAASEIPMMFVGGALIRRLGGMPAILFSYGLLIAGFFGSFLAWAPWVLLATGAMIGAGFGLFFIATVTSFDRRAPENWSASVQAMVNVGAFGFAPFVASFCGGLVYDAWPAGVYVMSTGLSLMAAMVLLGLIWQGRSRGDQLSGDG